MHRLSTIPAVLLLAACTYTQVAGESDPPPLSPLSQDRAAPGLALVAHAADRYFARQAEAPPTTCASLSPRPLTAGEEERLIARFERLAPDDRCVAGEGGGPVDSITGEPANLIQVYAFECPAPGETCAGWVTMPEESSARYAMRWEEDHWTFDRDRRLTAE